MKNLQVKKDNALVSAAYSLTLGEQRLVLLAAALAEKSGEDLAQGVKVSALEYGQAYGLGRNATYAALQEASRTLMERRVSFWESEDTQTVTRWVSFVTYAYGGGCIRLGFSPVLKPLLTDLQKRFTVYALEHVAQLTSVHAVRLYEMLAQWRSVGKTPLIDLADFRERLGILPDEYPRMTDFKSRVLDAAVKQINERTDLMVTYEQHKEGRSITGLSFSFAVKQPGTTVKAPAKPAPAVADRSGSQRPATGSDLPMPDYLQDAPGGLELTGEQRRAFAGKLASDPGKLPLKASAGESEQQYAARIEAALRDSLQAARWLPHLRRVGFRVAR